MSNHIIVSALQYTSSLKENETLKMVLNYMHEALKNKPDLITLPECATFLCSNKRETFIKAKFEADSYTISEISKFAKKNMVNVLIGSLQTKLKNKKNNLVNRSYLINSRGEIISKYDKIHMFDVKLSEKNKFLESKTYLSGNKAVIAELKSGSKKIKLGLTICYDLRFPHLYWDLARAGAEIIFVPSAFTKSTGQVHWHSLLKSRAIETGCFIVAPAQVGKHFPGRESFGHSLIVSPWGKILADAGHKKGVITAKINLNEINISRSKIPNLSNQKKYTIYYQK